MMNAAQSPLIPLKTAETLPPLDSEFKTVPGPGQSLANVADSKAEKEAISIAAGNLDDDAKAQEHVRTQSLRNHIHRAAITLVWIIFALFVVSAGILAWHALLPVKWAWLSNEQQSAVKTFVFSGAITTAAGGYLNKRIG